MSTQEIIISVDSTEVIDIEKIAKDNETIFTSFDDFVKEAIGLYINWWNDPEQSEKQFLNLLPHMHPKMIKSIEIIMDNNEFSDAMIGVAEKRKKLPKLMFKPLPEFGIQRFPLTPRQLYKIQNILKDETAEIKFQSVQGFFDYAINYFINLWTEPNEAFKHLYEMLPFMPAKTKSFWQNHPKWGKSFKNIVDNAEIHNQSVDSNNLIFEQTTDKNILENSITPSSIETVEDNVLKSPSLKQKQIDSTLHENNIAFSNNVLEKIQNETLEKYNQICNQYDTTCDTVTSIKIPSNLSKISLPDDDYPLISSFYSRFLPIKIAVTVLGHLMAENNETTVDYHTFRETSYDVAYAISTKIRHHEVRYNIKRHEKRSTGLPYAPVSSTILESDLKEFQKIETSKSRFQEHFVGMTKESWINRQKKSEKLAFNGLAYFDGALNAMGLVNVVVTKNKELPKLNDDTGKFEFQETGSFDFKIGLTKKGIDFCRLKNNIFDKNIQSFQKIIFSNNEPEFIFKEIIGKIDLEDKLVNCIIKTINHNSKLGILTRTKIPANKNNSNYIPTPGEKYIDESINLEFEKWTHKNKDTIFQDIIKISNPIDMTDDSTVEIKAKKKRISIRAAIMGRLSELNQITWDIEPKTSNTLYGLVKNKK
jgi:hypothetical protein